MIKKVGLIYGGKSVEHDISIKSAVNIYQNADKNKLEIIAIGIDKNGKWFLNSEPNPDIAKGDPLHWKFDSQSPDLINTRTNECIGLDVVFPIVHGTDGEDGNIQGLFNTLNLPIVGTNVLGSALCIDKVYSKLILEKFGIPVTKYAYFNKSQQTEITFQSVVNKIGLPFISKPANLGSSVGVMKVKTEDDFKKAIKEAFTYDEKVLFEEFISGRELECAILGNDNPMASEPGEIVIDESYEFYTFEAKYVDPLAVKINVPAIIDSEIAQQIKKHSIEAFKALACDDFARVDIFLSDDGKIYINEINTLPGFTNSSMFPSLWKEKGISYNELINQLVEMAIDRFHQKNEKQRKFDSIFSQ
ncbi:D-alanine--D-alanine ligase family protein [Aureibacter tunicatorum]|uniref:D-alanine--D-alanine ligase n=1 Tax=Aureibacter tunicatorum TaxID=866807 RepID=A0AAE3XMT1_9BACT|nr:D-alanine--D-alanine ligase family protein [Aureibacter tunicatorum]MDR6239347.1 D-alanine-D-alanine ligase [Aureibacter tunicatorum]BDD04730.1 D-alanine--D-alanine ligase [Aureibacter tunicatorum]